MQTNFPPGYPGRSAITQSLIGRSMLSPVCHMTVVRYYRDKHPSDKEQMKFPSWKDVEQAIRRMDNYCFPIVALSCKELATGEDTFDDEDSFIEACAVNELATLRRNAQNSRTKLAGDGFIPGAALNNIIGGGGRIALFQFMADWQYEDPNGSTEPTRLWESDQGYFCQERNIITDIEKVLRIVRGYYESGSYSHLNSIV